MSLSYAGTVASAGPTRHRPKVGWSGPPCVSHVPARRWPDGRAVASGPIAQRKNERRKVRLAYGLVRTRVPLSFSHRAASFSGLCLTPQLESTRWLYCRAANPTAPRTHSIECERLVASPPIQVRRPFVG